MPWFNFLRRKPTPPAHERWTAADFPLSALATVGIPEPPDADRIHLRRDPGGVVFTVSASDPDCHTLGPTDHDLLELALAVTPGAEVRERKPPVYVNPTGESDGGATYHPFVLAVTPANVLALAASAVLWSAEAWGVAAGHPVTEQAVGSVRRDMFIRFVERARAVAAHFPAPRAGEWLAEAARQARRRLHLEADN